MQSLRDKIRQLKHADEALVIEGLLAANQLDETARTTIGRKAANLVSVARQMHLQQGSLQAFLAEFGLSNTEGMTLMCLAEALLRIPDADTQDALIAERLLAGDWARHLGHSDSSFVNAGIWALMLSGRLVEVPERGRHSPMDGLKRLLSRGSEPMIRAALRQAMKIIGAQFVFAPSIGQALTARARLPPGQRLFSFDMLGEAARTDAAAQHYLHTYRAAIIAVGTSIAAPGRDPAQHSSVSIKLSALHPRYEQRHAARLQAELLPRLQELCLLAAGFGIQLTMDAEEADRLDLSLELFEQLCRDPRLQGWNGLGLAVQAYQKRALAMLDWLAQLATETGRVIPVRLVKGAYWDSEIKLSQVLGHADFPVFTRKCATDFSYLVCCQRLFAHADQLYPQFATHNAHSIAAVEHLGRGRPYELQRLYGMGELLYAAAGDSLLERGTPIRVYAPVGPHRELLPYLVRRLLENGANSSFIHHFMDPRVPVDRIVADPQAAVAAQPTTRGSGITHPAALYPGRRSARGLDCSAVETTTSLLAALAELDQQTLEAGCLIDGRLCGGPARPILSPADQARQIGAARQARSADIEAALRGAQAAQRPWDQRGGLERGAILRAMADALEQHRNRLLHLLSREAGRTLKDAVDEVREAVDFCRYYATQAEALFATPRPLPGPAGEANTLHWGGRGVFLCISPWNFPLAIFTGQVAAALAAGNSVIAKPAAPTPLIACTVTQLFHAAGVPPQVLQLLIGDGARLAAPLLADARIAGVAFTGSTATAQRINRSLAARDGAIVPLIAETGGQNAMVVDSTALLEQVTDDVMTSAFSSAGQRCSALRILLVQEAVADRLLNLLGGAMQELHIGDPGRLETDIGPLIDSEAREQVLEHCARMDREARLLGAAVLPATLPTRHSFFAPRIYAIDSIAQLRQEVFGPVLHVLRYTPDTLEHHLEALHATGYGLTFGIHTRISARADSLFSQSDAGNVYINRNMIGAVVEAQPFGGAGRSGTGPKAGGPHYLPRFAQERTRSINTAAIGANPDLFMS